MCALALESETRLAGDESKVSIEVACARFLDRPGLTEELKRQLAEERTPVRLMNALVEQAWEHNGVPPARPGRMPRWLLLQLLLCTALVELLAAAAMVCTNTASFTLYATMGMLGALCLLLGAAYWRVQRRSAKGAPWSLLALPRRAPHS